MPIEITCVVPSRSAIGEGAVWDAQDQRLWWVDISNGLIHCYDPDGGANTTFEFGEPVGCIARRDKGGLVVAAKSGFWFFDPATGQRQHILDPEFYLPESRFNDGGTDMQGRFWAGTMKDTGEPAPCGTFYRLDPDLSVTAVIGGFWTTNGLAFSPDGTRMYYSDSNPRVRKIWTCAYDGTTGTPNGFELFFDTRHVAGRPDGGTVDAEGCYWQAGIDGWCLYRISPQGEILRTVEVPIEKPTKPMFGGRDLETLYLTSLGQTVTRRELQPEAGSLFAITGLGIKGVPQARFMG